MIFVVGPHSSTVSSERVTGSCILTNRSMKELDAEVSAVQQQAAARVDIGGRGKKRGRVLCRCAFLRCSS
jgi:hypothetical protein